MSNSEVSVLIPVYNARSFVGEAIQSALQQTAGDLEIVIVDDASTDGSDEVIAGFGDPRIRRYRNQSNLGLVGNWNEALRHARGRYITMLHQDDVMEPTNVERKLRALRSSRDSWVASDCTQIDAAGGRMFEHWFQHPRALSLADRPREVQFAAMFFGANFLCFPTILWHREVTDTVGGFEPKGGYCVDIYMWLKILHRYRLHYLDERLIRYRWAQNESMKYNPAEWAVDEYSAKVAVAHDLSLAPWFGWRLKARFAGKFLAGYGASRLRGDRRSTLAMRRGVAALLR